MSIANWPATERPREKLLSRGARNLSDAELLALLLRTGCRGHSALDIARALLETFGNLSGLLHAPYSEFAAVAGMGAAKYTTLQAVLEISRRAMLESIKRSSPLTSPQQTHQYLRCLLAGEQREVFWALLLDSQHQVIASEAVAYGTIDSASIYPREVLKTCLAHNAAAVIFAHNHPSGSLTPSAADKHITQKLQQALQTVDIRLLDHIIIGHNRSVSMAELGLI